MSRSPLLLLAVVALAVLNLGTAVVVATRAPASPPPARPPVPREPWKVRAGRSGDDLVVIVVTERGVPVTDATVSARTDAGPPLSLIAVGRTYRGPLPAQLGHHELTIAIERGEQRFVQYASVDVP